MALERLGNKETPKSESECFRRSCLFTLPRVEKMREWDAQDGVGIGYHFIYLE